MLRCVWSHMRAFGCMLVVVVFGCALNVLQVVLAVLCKPWAPRLNRRLNDALQSVYLWSIAKMMKASGVDVHYYGEKVPKGRNAIVLSNHLSYLDPFTLFTFALGRGRIGSSKFLAKEVIQYMPGTGWGMLFLDMVFLKRNWDKDSRTIRSTFSRLMQFGDQPFWVLTFPEGTRFDAKKQKKCQEWSAQQKLPQLEHTLTPKTKGVVCMVEALRAHTDVIYDVTMQYEPQAPDLWTLFRGLKQLHVHMHVRSIPIADVPRQPDEVAEWVWDSFKLKQQLISHFKEHGSFPGDRYSLPWELGSAASPTFQDVDPDADPGTPQDVQSKPKKA